jgi:hypothetical protein
MFGLSRGAVRSIPGNASSLPAAFAARCDVGLALPPPVQHAALALDLLLLVLELATHRGCLQGVSAQAGDAPVVFQFLRAQFLVLIRRSH